MSVYKDHSFYSFIPFYIQFKDKTKSVFWKTHINLPFIFFLFSFCSNTIAQKYYFDNYSVAEGLYQSTVYDILQDNEDYIWLGTKGGASRFDGHVFENLTSQNGLAQNGVQVLFKDSKGYVWLGHLGGGISRIKNNIAEIYIQTGTLIKSDITDIAEDKLHRLWITTVGAGAFLISNPHDKPEKMKYEQFKGNRLSDRIFNITLMHDSSIYLVTDVGIGKYNYSNNSFEPFHPEGLTNYWATSCMIQDHRGNIWFGTYHGGLYELDAQTHKFKIFDIRDGLASNWVTSITEDSHGAIWLGSWGSGITRIDSTGLKIFNLSNGLTDAKIRCIKEDVEGNILIGTNEHGLFIFKGEQFVSYSDKEGLINPQVWAISQDNLNRMWFGTDGGITVFDPIKSPDQQFINYNEKNKNISNLIHGFAIDKEKNIWIGTNDQGVIEYVADQNRFIYKVDVNANIKDLIVTAIVIDRSNNLWVGTVDGLVFFNINKREGTILTQINGLAGNDISSLFVDKDNNLWVGSKDKGLTCIKDTVYKQYSLGGSVTPECFGQDNKRNIWIGTSGQGVIVLQNGKILKTYTEHDGLLANLINLLIIDRDDNVYIGTNKGLNKYIPSKNKMYTYSQKNGFTGIETKKNACFIDNKGNLWFGTVNGVMKYNPKLDKTISSEPLTHITRFRVNLQEVAMKEKMKLSYKENSIIIDYHSICLNNPEAVRYQVMLEGADASWQPITSQTMVSYSALSPNKYTFKVRARNSQGEWNSKPISFSFQINPPFYATWWFIIICIIIGVVVVFFYINWREKKLLEEKRILEEKVRERTHEVTLKNQELAMKNKNITDSIQYAQRIQFAILPPEVPFKDTFILFKPKDIVSGDFYWFHTDGEREFMAAVDCTGHGVPGAFMSIIGHILLNKIVKEYKTYQPAEILNILNRELTDTLHAQGETYINDGMDLALVCYEPQKNILQYAGAFNPLILTRDSELIEYRANRFSIGRHTGPDNLFTNNEIHIEKGDTIYIFSDGYEDQFGGDKGKKFKAKSMKDIFLNIHNDKIERQKDILDRTFEDWKKDYEQVDDILVIGRKLYT